jgi:hypothetical protein
MNGVELGLQWILHLRCDSPDETGPVLFVGDEIDRELPHITSFPQRSLSGNGAGGPGIGFNDLQFGFHLAGKRLRSAVKAGASRPELSSCARHS